MKQLLSEKVILTGTTTSKLAFYRDLKPKRLRNTTITPPLRVMGLTKRDDYFWANFDHF